MTSIFTAAAYGGAGWSPRKTSLRQEIGKVWGACGLTNEWAPLKAVLLHRPGSELGDLAAPDRAQMLAPLDVGRARQQHDALAQAYRDAGVAVYYVEPGATPPPNLMFVADLMFMTPEGVIDVFMPLVGVKPRGTPSGKDNDYGWGMPYGPLVLERLGLRVDATALIMPLVFIGMMTALVRGIR